MRVNKVIMDLCVNLQTIYTVKPAKDPSSYKDLVGSRYTKEFYVCSAEDVRTDGDIYELHEITYGHFDIISDILVGFVSLTRAKLLVKEARVDAALYPEFVGMCYMQKFMPAIVNVAKASGFAILMATTSMQRKPAMEACGYRFIEESDEDRGYFEYYVSS